MQEIRLVAQKRAAQAVQDSAGLGQRSPVRGRGRLRTGGEWVRILLTDEAGAGYNKLRLLSVCRKMDRRRKLSAGVAKLVNAADLKSAAR